MRYLGLFVYLETRRCQLEMATSLKTNTFLNAMRQMVAWRGCPKMILGEHGNNFVGVARKIKEMAKNTDQENQLAFIPPGSHLFQVIDPRPISFLEHFSYPYHGTKPWAPHTIPQGVPKNPENQSN